jgi:hypothetical protein
MSYDRELTHKEPLSVLWIIIGLVFMIGCMIGIERLIPRY